MHQYKVKQQNWTIEIESEFKVALRATRSTFDKFLIVHVSYI